MSNTPNMLTVMIDGIKTQVPEGTLVIEAARQVGVMVPHFCYHPKLEPDANCRMCLVEIEKIPKLQTSCSTRVAEGMVVRSSVPTSRPRGNRCWSYCWAIIRSIVRCAIRAAAVICRIFRTSTRPPSAGLMN